MRISGNLKPWEGFLELPRPWFLKLPFDFGIAPFKINSP